MVRARDKDGGLQEAGKTSEKLARHYPDGFKGRRIDLG